jgi:AraC-like DNA-binding protein
MSTHINTDTHTYADISTETDDVPFRFAKALLVQARLFGKDVEAIVRAADFPFNPLVKDNYDICTISVEQYSRLCMELFEALQDESGGIIQGISTPMGSSRMLIYSILHCQNLGEAMHRAIEFNAVCREPASSLNHNSLNVDSNRKWAMLSYLSQVSGQSGKATQDGVLCSIAIWLRVCSWLIGENIDVFDAGCADPRSGNNAGLRHFFHCPIEFDQPYNWVKFSAAILEAPIVRNEQDLDAFLKVAPYYTVIKPVENERSVAGRIRKIIGTDFQQELPAFDQLTGLLNMSARTLRRRLDKEGTSYQRIKDAVRRDVAIDLLGNPTLTISDVADLIGFSDPSAFHRSFKRWTGVSPGKYR